VFFPPQAVVSSWSVRLRAEAAALPFSGHHARQKMHGIPSPSMGLFLRRLSAVLLSI
jgi:hypothetical protein